MVRQIAIDRGLREDPSFRWRSHEVSRIEGLSDAVFAFAITLLVVALEVPETFTELLSRVRDFVGFLISFFLIFQVWSYQYTYFRRYGLVDRVVIWLNGALLFVVLFYVYPLKFLLTVMSRVVMDRTVEVHHADGASAVMITSAQMPQLMVLLGAGFGAVFTVFTLLYWHAYRQRERLDLDAWERLETRDSFRECVLFAALGATSAAVAYAGGAHATMLAGMTYSLMAPVQIANGLIAQRGRRRLGPRPVAD